MTTKEAHKLLKRAIRDLDNVGEFCDDCGLVQESKLLDKAAGKAEDVESLFAMLR